jgi:replicative DNA helicase
MRRGDHAADIDLIIKAKRELLGLPMSIEDGGGLSAEDIALKCRMAQQRHGIGLIVVDHLHIVRADSATMRGAGATQAVAQVAHAMQALAKTNNCPVLLLAQLNRGVESRDDHRPTMADLRQSGAIEEDADAVGFVYRPELHMRKSPPEQNEGESDERYAMRVNDNHTARDRVRGVAEVIFEKVRDGEPQTVPLRFDGPTASFREVREHG